MIFHLVIKILSSALFFSTLLHAHTSVVPTTTPAEEKISHNWDKQSEDQNLAWQYFDDEVSFEKTRHAFLSDWSLRTLYRELAYQRKNCEWVKLFLERTKQSFSVDLMNELNSSFKNNYSSTAEYQHSGTAEDICCGDEWDGTGWSEPVMKYFKEFSGREPFTSLGEQDKVPTLPIGLSHTANMLSDVLEIAHPHGFVLSLLEPTYRKLIATKNYFEFLQLSSKLFFVLSNFPQISFGSLAVNTWIFNHLAHIKFGIQAKQFPFMTDWVAYFETSSQHTNFFVITAIVNYCNSLQITTKGDEINTMYAALMPHMSVLVETSKKKELFAKIKDAIKTKRQHLAFTDEQNAHLDAILDGELEFRERSAIFSKYVDYSQGKCPSFDELISITVGEEKEYFEQLRDLSINNVELFIAAINDKEKQRFIDERWEDVLYAQYYMLNEHEIKDGEVTRVMGKIVRNKIAHAAFFTVEEFATHKGTLELCKGLKKEVSSAIENGMVFEEFAAFVENFTKSQNAQEVIRVLVSRSAVMLYGLNEGYAPEKFLADSLEAMEMKILSHVAQRFSQDTLPEILDEDTRFLLLHYLDPVILKNNSMSSLIGDTASETRKRIVLAYYDFIENSHGRVACQEKISERFSDDEMDKILKALSRNDRIELLQFDFENFIYVEASSDGEVRDYGW